ncbi:unnamed protein product [Arctogadus glacialis]
MRIYTFLTSTGRTVASFRILTVVSMCPRVTTLSGLRNLRDFMQQWTHWNRPHAWGWTYTWLQCSTCKA